MNIQVRAKKEPQNASSLSSLDPDKFFGKRKKEGNNYNPELKKQWTEWQNRNPDYFQFYIRVLFSFSGFVESFARDVAAYNTSEEGQNRPIILLDRTVNQRSDPLTVNRSFQMVSKML